MDEGQGFGSGFRVFKVRDEGFNFWVKEVCSHLAGGLRLGTRAYSHCPPSYGFRGYRFRVRRKGLEVRADG